MSRSEYGFMLGSLAEKQPASVILYSYKANGWRDQMTAYNGEKCEYDEMGRPTTYRNKAMSWSRYGALTSYNGNTYTYDANGIRLTKTVNGVTTKFFIFGTKILGMTIGTNKLRFRYGVNGIQGFSYNGQEYIYRKNIQGDITHIFKLTNGILALAAEYKYDAWGKCEVTEVDNSGIGEINPIRYRGYYYDTETKLYYLNARYYDPEVGRFISADSTQFLEPNTVNGLNLYAYCGNNPVMGYDPYGTFFLSLLIAAVVSAAASALGSIIVQAATTGRVDWAQVGISALFGAVSGALSFTGVGGIVGQFFIQGALAVGEMYSIAALHGEVGDIDPNQVVFTFLFAGAVGAVGSIGAAKEFKRIGQIEKNVIKYTMRDVNRYGAPLVKTFLSRGAKYINQFVLPFTKHAFVSAGISAVANISIHWFNQLWSKIKQ